MGKKDVFAPSRAKIEGSEIVIDVRMDSRGGRVGYRVSGKPRGPQGATDFGPFRELTVQGSMVRCASTSIFAPTRSFWMDEATAQVMGRATLTGEYVVAYDMLLTFIESRLSNELAAAQKLSKRFEIETNLDTLGKIKEGLRNSVVTKEQSVTARSWPGMLSSQGKQTL